MQNFKDFIAIFSERFAAAQFPPSPASLYEPNEYFLQIGGKRIRPALVLMGNELFEEINADSWHVAMAVELFHNFTLIHDDIMDAASLRRNKPTVHVRNGINTAILAGDVMFVKAYEHLNKIQRTHSKQIFELFNTTAAQVCEGQQIDMDFEQISQVSLQDYVEMIRLKTSVLLAACLKMGAIMGGAGKGNQQKLYEFGENLGLAFQIQDDYLDAFGDAEKVGKETGGDIRQNKKTFLAIRLLQVASAKQKSVLAQLEKSDDAEKVSQTIEIMKACGADSWALDLKEQYFAKAMECLDEVAVISKRKAPLAQLANYLLNREH